MLVLPPLLIGTPDEKTGLFMEINPKEMEDITGKGPGVDFTKVVLT